MLRTPWLSCGPYCTFCFLAYSTTEIISKPGSVLKAAVPKAVGSGILVLSSRKGALSWRLALFKLWMRLT
jgi:hypothetical protein